MMIELLSVLIVFAALIGGTGFLVYLVVRKKGSDFDFGEKWDVFKNSNAVRIGVICVLILFLNIPLGMVKDVIYSRVNLFSDTVEQISSDWGGSQVIAAPAIVVPVRHVQEESIYNEKKKVYETRKTYYEKDMIILPETLRIEAKIVPEIRYRGIFKVLVHSTDIRITGNFENPDLGFLYGNATVLWDRASLAIGVNSSLIRGEPKLQFSGTPLLLTPGSGIPGVEGVSASVKIRPNDLWKTFSLDFRFNGSGYISLAPLGKKNAFTVESEWPHPVFYGAFRPENPDITNAGFTAQWDIPYIARDYPQSGYLNKDTFNLTGKMATVGLFETMPVHKQALRLATYGILFIVLTFVMMFLFEKSLKRNLSYLQYGVIGLAVSLFFLCVTSFSEYLSFALSYTIAAGIVAGMISLYVYGALRSVKMSAVCAAVMGLLYAVLYLMLSEADYALLIGTFILLATMSAVMWATRNLNKQGA